MIPRDEHKDKLIMWKVIAHKEAVWSKWEGLGFDDYYYVQHRILKGIKRIKYFGYRPTQHPIYKEFKKECGIE